MEYNIRIFFILTIFLFSECAISQVTFEIRSSEDFKKILSIKEYNYEVISNSPLKVKSDFVIRNKSMWFIDITVENEIYRDGMKPNEELTLKGVILAQNSPTNISFYGGRGTAGNTWLKNLFNDLWIATFRESIPINLLDGLITLSLQFGPTAVLGYLKTNPEIIIKELTKLNIISSQTKLPQFIRIQDILGKVGKVDDLSSIFETILEFVKYPQAINEWLIISKKQEGSIRVGKYSEDGLIVYYPFNGNTKDESKNGNNAEPHSIGYTIDRFNNPESACTFNGSTSYIDATISELPQSNSLRTVSAWIQAPQNYSESHVIVDWGSPIQEKRFCILIYKVGNVNFFSSYANDITGQINLSDNKWHHIACVYDGAAVRMYIDGQLNGSKQIQLNTVGNYLSIGRRALGDALIEHFIGNIDDVRIYNRALNEQELNQLFEEDL